MGDHLPSYDELPTLAGLRCSWGVWPSPDVLGTLHLLTPERARAGAAEVRRGAVFPLSWDMRRPDPPLFGRSRFEHEVTGSDSSTSHDDVLHGWNTQSSTQWDGFRHVRNHAAADATGGTGHYAGVPDHEHGVHHWARRGLVGRGVLCDVGRWRAAAGRPLRHDAPDPIEPDDVRDTLAAQGATVEPGDILLIRTGWVGWYEGLDPEARAALAGGDGFAAPGLRSTEDTVRLLWDLHVAAVAVDNPAVEVWPPGALLDPAHAAELRADRSRLHELFVHTLLLPMLGIPLGELWYLEALAADCAADGRYACLLTSAPLHLPGGVASPPNALAVK